MVTRRGRGDHTDVFLTHLCFITDPGGKVKQTHSGSQGGFSPRGKTTWLSWSVESPNSGPSLALAVSVNRIAAVSMVTVTATGTAFTKLPLLREGVWGRTGQ